MSWWIQPERGARWQRYDEKGAMPSGMPMMLSDTDPNPAPRPSGKRKPIETLSRDEYDAIMAEPDASPEGARFRAISALLLASGLRIGEAVLLRVDSIEQMGTVAVIHVPCEDGAKTGARDVPVPVSLLEPYMSEWLRWQSGRWLFSTYAGTHVHPNSYSRALKLYGARCGIEKNLHAHMFRHTFAANWLRSGGALNDLQALLGHRDAKMSMRYAAHVSIDQLIETVRERAS